MSADGHGWRNNRRGRGEGAERAARIASRKDAKSAKEDALKVLRTAM